MLKYSGCLPNRHDVNDPNILIYILIVFKAKVPELCTRSHQGNINPRNHNVHQSWTDSPRVKNDCTT